MGQRAAVLATLALATACSGGSTQLAGPSTSPVSSITPSPTPSATRAVTSPQPLLSPTPSPTPRHTSSPRASLKPSPTRSPTPRPTHSPSPKPSPTPTGKTYSISQVSVDRFSPNMLTIHRGDSVRVSNKDSTDHTFTVPSMGKGSGDMAPGATYRLMFPNAGTFNFVCTIHQPFMKGTVTVTG